MPRGTNYPPEWYCGAFNPKRQKTCRNRAGTRTNHLGTGSCWMHLGTTPNVAAHDRQEAAVKLMRNAAATFGVPIHKDPEQALLDLVAESAGLCHWYLVRVQELVVAHDAPGPATGPPATPRIGAGEWGRLVGPVTTGAGLLGPSIELDKFGTEHVVGEDARAFLKLFNEERRNLARFAKAAIDAGISRKNVEQATHLGEQLVVILTAVLGRLGLAEDIMQSARQMLGAEMRLLADQERKTVVDGKATREER